MAYKRRTLLVLALQLFLLQTQVEAETETFRGRTTKSHGLSADVLHDFL